MQASQIPTQDRVALVQLKQWIQTHTGIFYKDESDYILYSRLMQVCFKYQLKDLESLYQDLHNQRDSGLSLAVAEHVSTTHTHFFREPDAFAFLEDVLSKNTSFRHPIRIWSAAASSGEEAYTIAICLVEKFGMQHAMANYQILGTDINADVIRIAETGIFHWERLLDVPPNLIEKYFKAVGLNQYQISPELKKMCTFRRMNLHSAPWPFQQLFHIVFCRNILYYFQAPQQKTLTEAIYRHTTPGAYLITSVTESLTQLQTPWVMMRPSIYQKRI